MDRESHLGTLIVVAVAFAMVIVPLQTAATHNSVGAGVNVVQGDEVMAGDNVAEEDRGTLVADVPSDPDSPGGQSPGWDASDFDGGDHPYVQRFHENLEDDEHASIREAPPDQTGEMYNGDCDTAGELTDLTDAEYDEALRNHKACYIGYFDMQWEYNIVTHTGLHHQGDTFKHSDDLYPVNPAEGDTYCSGEEDTGNRTAPIVVGDDSAADQAIAAAERSQDDDCSGANHDQYNTPHNLVIDTDLVERPVMGNDEDGQDGAGLTDTVGTEEGSGTLSLPFLTTFYFYIFGEPHPDNDDPMEQTASTGYFGGETGETGSPLTDISGACGDRTRECQMLEPFDIKRYDRYDTNDDPLDKARVCFYSPQFQTVNPGGDITGACGAFGSRVHEFVGNATAGGLGVTPTPTHVNNPAGWYANSFFVARAPTFMATNFEGDLQDDEEGFDDGVILYGAVNPKEPSKSSSVWCARPNFIGHEDPSRFDLEDGALSDQGFYDYAADAIDADVFVNPGLTPTRDVRDAIHDPVRGVLGPVQALADDTEGEVDDATQLPANDLVNRTDFVEAEDEDDEYTVDNPTDPWAEQRDPGLRCDGSGQVSFSTEPTELNTSVVFDVDVNGQSGGVRTDDTISEIESLGFSEGPCFAGVCTDATPKDPTLTSDGLPANESNTREGHWTTNAYTFSGRAVGVVDTNTNGEFDACTTSDGQPNPNRDQCPWTSLWDVYNGECTVPAGDTDCTEQAEQWDYAVTENSFEDHTSEEVGVGLYFVAHVTGPVATVDEEGTSVANIDEEATNQGRNQLIGFDGSAGDQHCIVGVSKNFTSHLATHLDGVPNDDPTAEQLTGELCGATSGEQVLIEDAFNDQKGANGDYSAALDIIQFEPTPNALEEDLGTGFGAGDELCVTGIWTVRDTADHSADTGDAQQMSGINTYSNCDPLDSGFKSDN